MQEGQTPGVLPFLQGQGASAVVAAQQGGGGSEGQGEGWLAAGLAGGQAALADARSGAVHAFWRAHDFGLTALACCGQHLLLTASQVCMQHFLYHDTNHLHAGGRLLARATVSTC